MRGLFSYLLPIFLTLTAPKVFAGSDPSCSQFLSTSKIDFQYGFESEYPLQEMAQLLRFYGPQKKMSEQQWLQLSDQERLQWVKENLLSNLTLYAHKSGLTLLSHPQKLDFLPYDLKLEPTRTLEVITSPVKSDRELKRQIRLINKNFGRGSMQAMVTVPKSFVFRSKQRMHQVRGALNFMQLLDTLSKLHNGLEKWRKQDSAGPLFPVKSFDHPYLGPMTRKKQRLQEVYFEANFHGKKFDPDSNFAVASEDSSFKFVGGTSYRPDIGAPDRVGFEIRDTHKNQELLFERVQRIKNLFEGPQLALFEKFDRLPQYDSEHDFAKLPKEIQEFFKSVAPQFKELEALSNPEELLAIEVFRNYGFPLMNWKPWVEALVPKKASSRLMTRISKAQNRFVLRMHQLAASVQGEPSIAVKQMAQYYLALFAEESGLFKIFERAFQEMSSQTSPMAASQ